RPAAGTACTALPVVGDVFNGCPLVPAGDENVLHHARVGIGKRVVPLPVEILPQPPVFVYFVTVVTAGRRGALLGKIGRFVGMLRDRYGDVPVHVRHGGTPLQPRKTFFVVRYA